MSTKIEWCNETWNPVWGCNNNCPYCYARKMAKRFADKIIEKEYKGICLSNYRFQFDEFIENINNFKPVWIWSNFYKKFSRKPSRIFVNSMSDIKYWKWEWMQRVLDKIKEYPQHTFLFLTKDLCGSSYVGIDFPDNCWLGYTITTQDQANKLALYGYYPESKKIFISIEPIQENITLVFIPDWLIVGMETGNRKNKKMPDKSWIKKILILREEGEVPIFMKNNLAQIWKDKLVQELPA